MQMGRNRRGRKIISDSIEERVACLVDRSERKRICRARSKMPDPVLVDKMRELTDENSVARSFLETALAELDPSRRKSAARD